MPNLLEKSLLKLSGKCTKHRVVPIIKRGGRVRAKKKVPLVCVR